MATRMADWITLEVAPEVLGPLPPASDGRRCSMAWERTARVRTIFFSNPMVTTRKGRPSESRTIEIGTPIFVVTKRPKRKAKTDEKMTLVASQKLDPMRRIDRKSETKVRCIEM